MPMTRSESNRKYYALHSDRIILRESELCPSAIAEIVECLRANEMRAGDKRIERLTELYRAITDQEIEEE